ncbi:MAG: ester cyclase [Actinomycetota bacterium]
MSAEANEQLLTRYVQEVWDKGDLDALERFLSPDFKRHVSPTLPPLDRGGQIERLRGFRSAFPDITLTVEDVVAGDDRVAFRSTIRGTHRGPFAGRAATEKQITVGLVDIVRIEGGLFVEQWGGPDMSDLFRQLESG